MPVVVVSHNDDASNAMQREKFCDIEQRFVCCGNDLSAVVVTTVLPFSFRIVATFMFVSARDLFALACDVMSWVLGLRKRSAFNR
jgi:hypothetical protein